MGTVETSAVGQIVILSVGVGPESHKSVLPYIVHFVDRFLTLDILESLYCFNEYYFTELQLYFSVTAFYYPAGFSLCGLRSSDFTSNDDSI